MLIDSNPGFAWSFSLGSGAYREADVSLSLLFRGWAVRDIRCTNFFFFTACEGRISLDAIRSALVAALVAGGGIVIFWLWRRRRST